MVFQRWFGNRRPIITQSPIYRFAKTNFTSSEIYSVSLEQDTAYGIYTPYNYIQITNNTDADVTVKFDTGATKSIIKGTIVSIGSDVVPSFRNFQIIGASAGNTGNVEVIVQKVIDYKEAIRMQSGYGIYE